MQRASDPELKARHRAMWASGDYPSMVETWLLPLGPRLVEAAAIAPGMRVLDVAAGTGNASLPAAQAGADVTASDLTPELLEAGRRRAEAAGLTLAWVEADAEHLPFEDASFDVVISAIGAMFAPHHQQTANELMRVCRPGGTIGLLSWTPEGMIGALLRTIGPFAPPPPPGAQPPPLWGSEAHLTELFGAGVDFGSPMRDILEVTAFEQPRDFGEHSRRATARPSPLRRTPGATGVTRSSRRPSIGSATNGTAARRGGRASSSSTCLPWAPAPDHGTPLPLVRRPAWRRRCAYEAVTSRCRSVCTAMPPDRGRWSAIVFSSSASSHGVR